MINALKNLELYSSSSLHIINAFKNNEILNNNTNYVAIEPIPIQTIKIKNVDKLGYKNITIIEKPDLLKEEDKFNLIFVNQIYNFDYNYINLLLKNGGYIIINEDKEDELKKFELYLNLYNLSSFYNYENYEIEAWKVYKKISDDYNESK
jgi:precorrin-6B methylase 2